MVEELKSGLTSEHLKYCSLEAIAHYSGIGVSRICAWVTQGERPSRRSLEKLGKAFDTPPEDVLQIISSRTIDFSRRKALNEELKSAIQSSSNRNDFLAGRREALRSGVAERRDESRVKRSDERSLKPFYSTLLP